VHTVTQPAHVILIKRAVTFLQLVDEKNRSGEMMHRPMPRDIGGVIEITEGSGPIRSMISTGDLLEIYKVDKTFRVQTPETIDPKRTNPNAPFTLSTVQDVGTSNRIVARVLLQCADMLNMFFATQEQLTAIRKQLHQCKELLLRAEASTTQVSSKIKAIEEQMRLAGPPEARRVVKTPHVESLEADCGNFLVEINRAIRAISGLPSLFIPLERADNNFDHLGQRLTEKIGANEAVTKFVTSNAGNVRHLVEMRNYLEHPNGRRTVVNNFKLLPDGKLSTPTWHLSGEAPVEIVADMAAMIDLLVSVSEEMLIHLVMYSGRERFVYSVEEIAEDQMDRDFPVKYKLVAYFKPFQPPGQTTP
jgi:hypothetical protein